MEQQLVDAWNRMNEGFSLQQGVVSLTIGLYLVLGGLAGMYLRFFFRRFGVSVSDSDAVSRVFPLLIVITTATIAVIKSSLALSLGLVGALSIVRFRSAIKEPEELVYLFLCVAIGLALGAELPTLALVLLVVASGVALVMHAQGKKGHDQNLLLTISGDSESDFGDGNAGVLSAVEEIAGKYALQRFDLAEGRGQLRVVLRRTSPKHTTEMITRLRRRLPECEFSYVNLNSSI
jgi:hypothetical protein